jgi:hypothetical protein
MRFIFEFFFGPVSGENAASYAEVDFNFFVMIDELNDP